MSRRTPTPLGYGNSTHFLTLEVIEVVLTKDRARDTNVGTKRNKGTSSGKTNKQLTITKRYYIT
jgi:hypothetical protein